ncbi:MAG: hypothetical protein KKA73_05895 [Chloroflexi bacterium]|nr:hypothetical protein [Chloroflexota bacterium]
MEKTIRNHSFVVRIWREEEDTPAWRGWVQHAGTGEETYVRELDELLAFIEHRAGRLAGSSSASDVPAPGLK